MCLKRVTTCCSSILLLLLASLPVSLTCVMYLRYHFVFLRMCSCSDTIVTFMCPVCAIRQEFLELKKRKGEANDSESFPSKQKPHSSKIIRYIPLDDIRQQSTARL